MIIGIDADTVLTPFATKIAAARVKCADGSLPPISAVGRYTKNFSIPERKALSAAGIGVWLIFEAGAENVLAGANQGAADGIRCLLQCNQFQAPSEAAIYATADTDVTADQLAVAEAYWVAFDAKLWPDATKPPLHPIGGYADGTLLSTLRDDGMPYCWLAGAMGWDGSRNFEATASPTMVQGPQLDHGGSWRDMEWPDLGFSYDPNIILADDFGCWKA